MKSKGGDLEREGGGERSLVLMLWTMGSYARSVPPVAPRGEHAGSEITGLSPTAQPWGRQMPARSFGAEVGEICRMGEV